MVGQKLIPFEGVDLNSSELYINDKKSPFLKNITFDLNRKVNSPGGQNVGIFSPVEGAQLYCNTPFLPAGFNFCIGTFAAKEKNQTYVFVFNSNGDHLIYRLNGSTGGCQKVSQDRCWNFQLNPKHFISEGRCAIQTVTRFNKRLQKDEEISFIVFTDYFNPVRSFVPEDLISTNSYDVTLPYFNVNDPDCRKCDWYNLGVPTPMECIEVTPIKRDISDPEERVKPNLLAYKSWQFRQMDINIYGQDSEHGVISTQYIGVTGNSCIQDSSGVARCVRLKFPAGCPLIDKHQIEFRNCNGAIRGFAVESDWYLYEVINKYKDCDTTKNWWEREINNPWKDEYDFWIAAGKTIQEATAIADSKNLLKYNAADNTFEYTFCANRECAPIPVSQTNRLENPLALIAGNVFSLNKNIGLARLTKKFEPLDCKELDKISFTVTKPQPDSVSCKAVLRKVTIWAQIWNPYVDQVVRLRKDAGRTVFGIADCPGNNPFNYHQVLPVDQEGLIGYMAGTSHYAISRQYRYNLLTGEYFNDGLNWNPTGNPFQKFSQIALQKFEFDIPPGKYVFRIGGHEASPTDDYQKTSTYFAGTATGFATGNLINEFKEILVDVCDADFELKTTPIQIYDFTFLANSIFVDCNQNARTSGVVSGYLYEDEIDKRPIELARVEVSQNRVAQSAYTDHNGFFFAASLINHFNVKLFAHKNCAVVEVGQTDFTQNDLFDTNFANNHVKQDIYVYKFRDKYLRKDQVLVKGKIVLCSDNSIGVNGALVILREGQFAFTDVNGEFTIVAHRWTNGTRVDAVIYSQRGTCILLGCSATCTYCFPDGVATFPACDGTDHVLNMSTIQVRIKGLNKRGPTSGGRYGIGAVVSDWLGRETNVQIRDKHYIDIPSIQDTQVYDYSTISFSIDPSFRLPSQFRKISFYITENLNFDDYITWVAERVQFVDNTGKVNNVAPTQIRLYYESLSEYSKQNNFSTNAVWDFLENETGKLGDQVEFLANGDGTIFTKRINSLVKYDKSGKYIAVDYNDELRNLKDGALIRIIRPKQCVNKQYFYQLCPILRVTNGIVETLNGTLPFYDSYLLSRQIPVPVETITSSTNSTGSVIQTSTSVNQLKTYPFLFEHHSPSDFWGDHCYSKGRINVKNPYESQHTLDTGIQLSKALANDGILNGLHYFDDADQIILNEQEWGGITCVLPEVHFLLVICEQNNFTLGYDDGTLRQRKDGTIATTGAEGRFGKPERKVGSVFGCNINDVSTIRRYAGLVYFVDRSKSALVVHNFSEAKDVSVNSFKGLIKSMVRMVLTNSLQYLFGVIDPKSKEYLLSTQDLFLNGKVFINDADDVDYDKNQTIAIDIFLQTFKGFRSYIPEYFGTMESDISDEQLICFVNGRPWKMHNTTVPYCNFFGVQCKPRIAGVANLENTKEKSYMALEVYCPEVVLEAYKVKTGAGQLSRIRETWWDKRNTFQCAAFLCDLNTKFDPNLPLETGVNKLTDGDTLYGRWVSFYLTPRTADDGKYFEYTASIVFFNGVEKSSSS